MKRTLLLLTAACCLGASYAQDSKKTTAYAITGVQKGSSSWTEVRLVDLASGEEMQSVYQSAQTVEALNARTGKPVVKKETPAGQLTEVKEAPVMQIIRKDAQGNVVSVERKVATTRYASVSLDKPFSTNSAALAFDKKHNRLYYTPMGISQLRYIDLKSGKIYYFEEEAFGVLKSRHDIPNQITRMVIASDGNGYALTNDANHLIQFTTGKKPKITDLGALSDDAANGIFSVHARDGFGGDIIADVQKNLYLITASRNVFKISLESKVATFMGTIRGLPKGFTTNGAAVEEGSKVIVTSSSQTLGYYRFDLNSLQTEKISASSSVYNASDLANGNLAFDKKKKDRKLPEIKHVDPTTETAVTPPPPIQAGKPVPTIADEIVKGSISLYPNPVTTGLVNLSFNDQPLGRYSIQFMDISGKTISQRQVNIQNKTQVVEYRLPGLIAAGNYVIKVVNEANEVTSVNKLVVQ